MSGLYYQSFTLSRLLWDNSAADRSWNATVAVATEIYNFSLTKSLALRDGEHWYMRHFYLHAGSEIFIRSCVLQDDTENMHVCLIKEVEHLLSGRLVLIAAREYTRLTTVWETALAITSGTAPIYSLLMEQIPITSFTTQPPSLARSLMY